MYTSPAAITRPTRLPLLLLLQDKTKDTPPNTLTALPTAPSTKWIGYRRRETGTPVLLPLQDHQDYGYSFYYYYCSSQGSSYSNCVERFKQEGSNQTSPADITRMSILWILLLLIFLLLLLLLLPCGEVPVGVKQVDQSSSQQQTNRVLAAPPPHADSSLQPSIVFIVLTGVDSQGLY